MQRKIIISCAITGSIHTPSMSPHLPVTPVEIAASAIEAAEAGAAVLHLHARDPKTGAPTPDVAVFEQFVPRIRAATKAIVNITTGGSARMTIEGQVLRSDHDLINVLRNKINQDEYCFATLAIVQNPFIWACVIGLALNPVASAIPRPKRLLSKSHVSARTWSVVT